MNHVKTHIGEKHSYAHIVRRLPLAVWGICSCTKPRKMNLLHRLNGAGGQMKTIGLCSIDVLDSKTGFGISAPPGEN